MKKNQTNLRRRIRLRGTHSRRKAKVLVILEDETGQESSLSVEDDWLRAQGLEEGSAWPEN